MIFDRSLLVICFCLAVVLAGLAASSDAQVANTWDFSRGNSIELVNWPDDSREEYILGESQGTKLILPDGISLEGNFLWIKFQQRNSKVERIQIRLATGTRSVIAERAKEVFRDLKLFTLNGSGDDFLNNLEKWEELEERIPFLAARRINYPLIDLSIAPVVGVADWNLTVSINTTRLPVSMNIVKFSQALAAGEIDLALLEKIDPRSCAVSGDTLLHEAIALGRNDTAMALMERGADVTCEGVIGQTPLYTSILYGNFEMADELISRNANINAKTSDGHSMLHLVAKSHCKSDDLKTAKWLVQNGVDLNSVDQYGNTALHYAIRKGNEQISQYLVEVGADTTIKNHRGNLASEENPFELLRPRADQIK